MIYSVTKYENIECIRTRICKPEYINAHKAYRAYKAYN